MTEFPRTTVDGISLPRMLIGSNWFLGYSHTSGAKDKFIKAQQTPAKIADIIAVFMEHGIDAVMGPPQQLLQDSICEAEQRLGKKLIRIYTPMFNPLPNAPAAEGPEAAFDICQKMGATFCFPHTSVTDALLDKMHKEIRHMRDYSRMIRARHMVPGLSTHMPEAVVFADQTNLDVASYIQLYNAIGFLMQIEVDWVMRIIRDAKKPVMTIKPLAAGRLLPPVGLAFVWSTLRDQDMVTVGTNTPDEAREVIDISLDLLARRLPSNELQWTRSKKSLT